MQFLKAIWWFVLLALTVGFAAQNWHDVTINLWDDLQIDIKLPVLLILVGLVGFVPAWAGYRIRSARLARWPKTVDRPAPETPAPVETHDL